MPNERTQQALDALKEHCKEIGRDYSDVKKSLFVVGIPVFVTESKEELDGFLKELAERYSRPLKQIKARFSSGGPGVWAGTLEEIIERFQYYIDMGFEYFQVLFNGHDEKIVDYSKDFAEKVMKKF